MQNTGLIGKGTVAKIKQSENLIKMFQLQYDLYSKLLKDRANTDLDSKAMDDPMPLLLDNYYFVVEELHEMGRNLPYMRFWKKDDLNTVSRMDEAKEEFIDTLHFLIDMGIILLIQPTMYSIPTLILDGSSLKDRCGTIKASIIQITRKLSGVVALKESDIETGKNSVQMYHNAGFSIINDCLTIASALQMTNQEVFDLYVSKNKTNHKRQETGY